MQDTRRLLEPIILRFANEFRSHISGQARELSELSREVERLHAETGKLRADLARATKANYRQAARHGRLAAAQATLAMITNLTPQTAKGARERVHMRAEARRKQVETASRQETNHG